MIISGTMKPGNWLKRLLNVMDTRTMEAGRKLPAIRLRIMAMMTRGRRLMCIFLLPNLMMI